MITDNALKAKVISQDEADALENFIDDKLCSNKVLNIPDDLLDIFNKSVLCLDIPNNER
jgi:hypothetical protein